MTSGGWIAVIAMLLAGMGIPVMALLNGAFGLRFGRKEFEGGRNHCADRYVLGGQIARVGHLDAVRCGSADGQRGGHFGRR